MQVTVIIPELEGSIDSDYPPVVKAGHMTLEQANEHARECSVYVRAEG